MNRNSTKSSINHSFPSPTRTIVAAALAVAAMAGCGTHVDFVPTNTPPRPMAPRPAEQVVVYTASQPDKPFVEVGIIEARQESTLSTDAPPEVLNELRARAGEAGCDGIILNGSSDKVVGYSSRGSGQVDTLTGYRAACIVFR